MLLSVIGLGFLIGMQHALEADHVAAVSSIASRQSGIRSISRHGTYWGIGHAMMLIAVAGTAIILNIALSEHLTSVLEFCVGMMLVGLGGHVLWRFNTDRVHFHAHSHDDGKTHIHAHSHLGDTEPHVESAHDHAHPERIPWRALAVGIMHGMAGSAALIVLTAATLASPLWGFIYIVVFGLGSIAGMAVLSAAIALPLTYTARSVTWLHGGLQLGIGCATIALGVVVMSDNVLSFYA